MRWRRSHLLLASAAVYAALLGLSVPLARASQQWHEHLIWNGQVLTMQSTPLSPLIEARDDLKALFRSGPLVSLCERGYVGTWHIEGDRLYLVSLVRGAYDPSSPRKRGEIPKVIEEEVPMSRLFGDQASPVLATWFSGTLRVPRGSMYRMIWSGFGSHFEREIRIEVSKGRVISRHDMDNRVATRGRCSDDLIWATVPREETLEDRAWLDGRQISRASFRQSQPEGARFRTRGILRRGPEPSLEIPSTPVTPSVRYPLVSVPKRDPERPSWRHVEIECSWGLDAGAFLLRVHSMRLLERGESIHHPEYPLPALTQEEISGWEREAPRPLVVVGEMAPERAFRTRRAVELRGVLRADPAPHVVGADVQADPALVGKQVVARGELQKWIITQRLLDLDLEEVRPFRSRGAGTYYRLVDPSTGALIRPTVAEAALDPK